MFSSSGSGNPGDDGDQGAGEKKSSYGKAALRKDKKNRREQERRQVLNDEFDKLARVVGLTGSGTKKRQNKGDILQGAIDMIAALRQEQAALKQATALTRAEHSRVLDLISQQILPPQPSRQAALEQQRQQQAALEQQRQQQAALEQQRQQQAALEQQRQQAALEQQRQQEALARQRYQEQLLAHQQRLLQEQAQQPLLVVRPEPTLEERWRDMRFGEEKIELPRSVPPFVPRFFGEPQPGGFDTAFAGLDPGPSGTAGRDDEDRFDPLRFLVEDYGQSGVGADGSGEVQQGSGSLPRYGSCGPGGDAT